MTRRRPVAEIAKDSEPLAKINKNVLTVAKAIRAAETDESAAALLLWFGRYTAEHFAHKIHEFTEMEDSTDPVLTECAVWAARVIVED